MSNLILAVSGYTASDQSMLIWTIASATVQVIQAAGVFILIFYQIKTRREGEPPIDIAKQLGELQQGMKMNTARLDTHATLITDVAKSMPPGSLGPINNPTQQASNHLDVTVHEDKK